MWQQDPMNRASSPDYVAANYVVQIQSPQPAATSFTDQAKQWYHANRRLVIASVVVAAIVIIIIVGVVATRNTSKKELGPPGPNYIEPACDNLYHFSCDPWINTRPQTYYQHRWYTPIQSNNNQVISQLFSQVNNLHPAVASLYRSCSDQAGVSSVGLSPLTPYLNQITAAQDWTTYWTVLGSFRLDFLTEAFVHLEMIHDLGDPTYTRLYLLQGGLSLEDPSSYSTARTLTRFQNEIAAAFLSVGDSPAVASSNANLVVQFEQALLNAFQGDPDQTWNIGTWQDLQSRTGTWMRFYLTGAQVPLQTGSNFRVNVYTPIYFKSLQSLISSSTPTNQHIQYARWRLLNSTAAFLPVGWRSSLLEMSPTLGGLSKPEVNRHRIDPPQYVVAHEPRVLHTPNNLGDAWSDYCQEVVQLDELTADAFGQSFVNRTFSQQARSYVEQTVLNMQSAFMDWTPSIDWADSSSQNLLQQKFTKMQYFIAGATPVSGYSGIQSQLSNSGTRYFENTRIIRRMKELDRFSYINKLWNNALYWQGSADTVNAYYQPSANSFFLFAGIMQAPAFQVSSDPLVQLRNQAWLYFIGHEAGHGIDNSGLQYTQQGVWSPGSWLSSRSYSGFNGRLPCLYNSYSGMSEMGVNVNGRYTIGENIADIVGVRLATHMFKQWQVANNATNMTVPTNFQPQVYTIEQYFWVLLAQNQCEVTDRNRLRYQVQVDVHSPGFARANGPAANIEDFGVAFGCRRGEDMYPHDQCFIY